MTIRSFRSIGGGMGLRRRGSSGGVQTVMTAGAGFGTSEAGIGFYYDRLMQVAINNTFYNAESRHDPDFTIAPVRHTQRMMNSLGLLFRDEGAGFSILYDTRRTDGLLRYLRRHAPEPAQIADEGAGTRLSFALTLRNPNFCYFTDLPFDFDPNSACYYVSNRMAHEEAGRVVLNALAFVPQSDTLQAVDGQYDVHFPEDANEIEVVDVLGNVVQCYPRAVPVDLFAKNAAAADSCVKVAAYLKAFPGAETKTRQICTINFYLLPAGCYTIRFVGSVEPARPVIYRAEFYQALCFIDLFLADPVRNGPGIFPIDDLFDPAKTTIKPVAYNLDFAARSTYWEYFIVPPSKGARLHDLKITRRNGDLVQFSPATRIPIGLDTVAYRTVSEVPLTMQNRSDYDLRLSGRIQDDKGMTARDATLMPRLPVAPRDWALPLDPPAASPAADPTHGRSTIYVYL